KPAIFGSISRYDGKPISPTDPWMKVLFVFNGDAAKPPLLVCFDDLLKLDHKVLRAEREADGGRQLVAVEVRFIPSATTTFWFDPSVNYLVRRTQATVTNQAGKGPTVF